MTAVAFIIWMAGVGAIGWGLGHVHGWDQGRLHGRAEILDEHRKARR